MHFFKIISHILVFAQFDILSILGFLQKEKSVSAFFKIISHTLVFAQFDELQLLNKWKSISWAGLRKCSVFIFQVKNEWNFR